MTVNRERLVKLVEWAAGQDALRQLGLPNEWDQSYWFIKDSNTACGTTCCLAGKVALDDGHLPTTAWDAGEQTAWEVADDGAEGISIVLDGKSISVKEYAQEALGLSDLEADRLFYGGSTLADVLSTVRRILVDDAAKKVGE